jgi:hypothetical protein
MIYTRATIARSLQLIISSEGVSIASPFKASITVQSMLPCPSPPANLVKMSIRVVSLVFELYALYYRSPCILKLSFTTENISKGGGVPVYRVQCRWMNLFIWWKWVVFSSSSVIIIMIINAGGGKFTNFICGFMF